MTGGSNTPGADQAHALLLPAVTRTPAPADRSRPLTQAHSAENLFAATNPAPRIPRRSPRPVVPRGVCCSMLSRRDLSLVLSCSTSQLKRRSVGSCSCCSCSPHSSRSAVDARPLRLGCSSAPSVRAWSRRPQRESYSMNGSRPRSDGFDRRPGVGDSESARGPPAGATRFSERAESQNGAPPLDRPESHQIKLLHLSKGPQIAPRHRKPR